MHSQTRARRTPLAARQSIEYGSDEPISQPHAGSTLRTPRRGPKNGVHLSSAGASLTQLRLIPTGIHTYIGVDDISLVETCTCGSLTPRGNTCLPGPSSVPLDVDDGNDCTADSCDPVLGGIHTPQVIGALCDDDNLCTANDVCDAAGTCHGTATPVDDGNECTGDTCTPSTGTTHTPLPGYDCGLRGTCDDVAVCREEVPPDPASIAPPLDLTTPTTFESSLAFLYSGPEPIQYGVASGTLVPERLAVIRGRVIDGNGAPLEGVQVTALERPEYGLTRTRIDGRFDLVVNGAEQLTIDMELSGRLPVSRKVKVGWHGTAQIDDCVMIVEDAAVATIQMNAAAPQLARGSLQVDADGARQAALLFPSGVRAEVTLSDGTVVPEESVDALAVRLTEYTVGPRGGMAMPAELPPNSEFTYAFELSADGTQFVHFSTEVPLYVENFLGFDVGTEIPLGYYDRGRGVWIAADNGIVLKVLNSSGSSRIRVGVSVA